MDIRPIRSEADYKAALAVVSDLIDRDPAPDSPEGERLEIMGLLVQAWEEQHYPIDPPDPIDAIQFRMEQGGLTVDDLAPYIGARNRVYEVLARKRPLSLLMIRRLSTGLGISAQVLIGQSQTR
jgi:HTH-type transcriptional regulator/antitoxin HigA